MIKLKRHKYEIGILLTIILIAFVFLFSRSEVQTQVGGKPETFIQTDTIKTDGTGTDSTATILIEMEYTEVYLDFHGVVDVTDQADTSHVFIIGIGGDTTRIGGYAETIDDAYDLVFHTDFQDDFAYRLPDKGIYAIYIVNKNSGGAIDDTREYRVTTRAVY